MYETNHDATEPTSYYQIAGIHGQPILPWNDATRDKDVTGYCTHSSVLFPTWHRAYMLLFEVRRTTW
jgi:tyrosinase